jgi:hypothetical protein
MLGEKYEHGDGVEKVRHTRFPFGVSRSSSSLLIFKKKLSLF